MKVNKKGKGLLALILTFVMVAVMVPVNVSAAGTTSVWMGGGYLSEGENSVGGGTATLNTSESTLTLENVSVAGDGYIHIDTDSEFTIVVKGKNSIGSETDACSNSSAVYSSASKLNIQIESGAVLSLYAEDMNSIYLSSGSLEVSGSGKLVAKVTGADGYPAICAEGDITLNDSLAAEITSDGHGIQTNDGGNIRIENANVTAEVSYVGLFAEGGITMKNSVVNITTSDEDNDSNAVYCWSDILLENTKLTTNAAGEGYSLYNDENIVIDGEQTVINAEDGQGISAGNILTISGGKVTVSSDDGGLNGYSGITISGGSIEAKTKKNGAITSYAGKISITGDNTSVIAITNDAEQAAIRNVKNGGIYLNAYVVANNAAGGKPVLGINRDGSVGIIVGDGFDADDMQVYTDSVPVSGYPNNINSYFVSLNDENNTPVTGSVDICKHVWGDPVWNWTEDYSEATATFACTQNPNHTKSVTATISSQTTDATCTKEGQTVYIASVTLAGKDYTDEKTITISVKDHKYENGKCTVCGADDPNYKLTEQTSGNSGKQTSNESTNSKGAPKTGDNSNMALWITLLLLSGIGVVGITVYSKRKKRVK